MDTESMATERARRAWEEEQAAAHAAELKAADDRSARTEVCLHCIDVLRGSGAVDNNMAVLTTVYSNAKYCCIHVVKGGIDNGLQLCQILWYSCGQQPISTTVYSYAKYCGIHVFNRRCCKQQRRCKQSARVQRQPKQTDRRQQTASASD
jgi:hypothetical protein